MKSTREIKLWAKLKNEYILEYKSSWIEDELEDNASKTKTGKLYLFIASEFCDMSLRDAIETINKEIKEIDKNNSFQRMRAYLATNIFLEILQGVKYLHDLNLVHKDLKPGNILITLNNSSSNFVKIADFGLTNELIDPESGMFVEEDEEGKDFILDPARGGTKGYMAPETQFDTSADLLSLGIILCDLMNFDQLNLPQISNDEKQDDTIMPIIWLIRKMTHDWKSERPSCEDIITHKKEWLKTYQEIRDCHFLTDLCFEWFCSKTKTDIDILHMKKLDKMNLVTKIIMTKIESEIERNFIDSIRMGKKTKLEEQEFKRIKYSIRVDRIISNLNENLYPEYFKQIFTALVISGNLDELNINLQTLLNENSSGNWLCFSTSFEVYQPLEFVNWYRCPYIFVSFYNIYRRETCIQLLLVDTRQRNNILESKNIFQYNDMPDFEILTPILTSFVQYMPREKIKQISKKVDLDIEVNKIREIILSHMEENFGGSSKWECCITSNELFLALKLSDYKVDFIVAFRKREKCFLIFRCEESDLMDYENLIKWYDRTWDDISMNEKLILEKALANQPLQFRSIHIRMVKLDLKSTIVSLIHNFPYSHKFPYYRFAADENSTIFDFNVLKLKVDEYRYKIFLDESLCDLIRVKKNLIETSICKDKSTVLAVISIKASIKSDAKLNSSVFCDELGVSNINKHFDSIPDCKSSENLKVWISETKNIFVQMNGPYYFTEKIFELLIFLQKDDFPIILKLKILDILLIFYSHFQNGLVILEDGRTHFHLEKKFILPILELFKSLEDNLCFRSTSLLINIVRCCEKCRDFVLDEDLEKRINSLVIKDKPLKLLRNVTVLIRYIYFENFNLPKLITTKELMPTISILFKRTDRLILDKILKTLYIILDYEKEVNVIRDLLIKEKIFQRLNELLILDDIHIQTLVLKCLEVIQPSARENDAISALLLEDRFLRNLLQMMSHNNLELLTSLLWFVSDYNIQDETTKNKLIEYKILSKFFDLIVKEDFFVLEKGISFFAEILFTGESQDICKMDNLKIHDILTRLENCRNKEVIEAIKRAYDYCTNELKLVHSKIFQNVQSFRFLKEILDDILLKK
jgi:serine/threonine protein kinase